MLYSKKTKDSNRSQNFFEKLILYHSASRKVLKLQSGSPNSDDYNRVRTPPEEFTLSLSNLTGTEGGQGREGPFTGTSDTPQVGVLYRPAADNLSRRWQLRTSAAFLTACLPSQHFYRRGWPCGRSPLPSPPTVWTHCCQPAILHFPT